MAKKRPVKDLLVLGDDDKLFIRADQMFPLLIRLTDNLPLVTFRRNRQKTYIAVDDAIAWCNKEIADGLDVKHWTEWVAGLERAKQRLVKGQFEIID